MGGSDEPSEFKEKVRQLDLTNLAFKKLMNAGKSVCASVKTADPAEVPPTNPAKDFQAQLATANKSKKNYNRNRLNMDTAKDMLKREKKKKKNQIYRFVKKN